MVAKRYTQTYDINYQKDICTRCNDEYSMYPTTFNG